MNEPHLSLSAMLDRLPPAWAGDSLPDIVRANAQPGAPKVVVLDDDPTGTQTVRDIPVLTTWGVPELAEELASAHPGFYLLTNSRSLSRVDTVALHRQIATHLLAAAAGRPFTVVSRGDSTLRGHYPAETDALAGVLGPMDLTVIAPFFEAGRRLTLDAIHYLADGDMLIPVAETPFARDPVFGYSHSSLPEWIEEKTGGAVTSSQVHSLPLARMREGGPASAAEWLRRLPEGAVCVANAVCTADIEVFAAAAVAAEQSGRRILYRTAAALAAARLGQRPQALLGPDAFLRSSGRGGLIVAGSFVPKTTVQLARLREVHAVQSIELPVEALLDSGRRPQVVHQALADVEAGLAAGRVVLLATSRCLVTGANEAANLEIGRQVSEALVEVTRRLSQAPCYLIAKGGITSSDLATLGLGVRRAMVAGQLLPGVPVWRLGSETRFPSMPYVVFPGNVGDDQALADAVTRLSPLLTTTL
ncbi:MAG: hypothetical protein JNJ82_11310 [Opitutaceae bacterium]|nr:hypothetical protein [Opitutaceae bacterium]